MSMKPMALSKSNFTTGYLIISAIAVMAYTLALDDLKMLVFAIPLLLVFVLGDSKKGSVDSDLKAVGWTSENTEIAIPLGIIGGFAALILGGLVMQFTPANVAAIVPDMAAIAVLATGSVIPAYMALGMNILSQFFIIAPSEESLSKIILPIAGMSFFKNVMLAYAFGTTGWIMMHIPTFIIGNTPFGMYYVLAILGAIGLIVYWITKTIIAPGIAHSTFNTGVLLTAAGINVIGFYLVGILVVIISLGYRGGKK